MSAYEVTSLILAVIFGSAGIVGAYFAILAYRNARESAQAARESVELAREQASMRPDLQISFAVTRERFANHQGRLQIEVHNAGKTSAHNVHGWIYLPADAMGPVRPSKSSNTSPSTALGYTMPYIPPSTLPHRSSGILFDDDQEAEDGRYEAQIYETTEILPDVVKNFEISVEFTSPQSTPAAIEWSLTCSELPIKRGLAPIEIPSVQDVIDQEQ
jgi:hypothetical protein